MLRFIEYISNYTDSFLHLLEANWYDLEAILRHLEAISDPRNLLLTDGIKLLTGVKNVRINNEFLRKDGTVCRDTAKVLRKDGVVFRGRREKDKYFIKKDIYWSVSRKRTQFDFGNKLLIYFKKSTIKYISYWNQLLKNLI